MDFSSRSDHGYLLEDAHDESATTPVSIYAFQTQFPAKAVMGNAVTARVDVRTSANAKADVVSSSAMPSAILHSWGNIAKAQMSVVFYRRLVQLANAKAGWRGPGSKPLDAVAIKTFLRFWTLVRENAAEPELSLVPDGTLLAEWRKSDHHRLDVRFASQLTFFGLLTPKNVIEGADSMSTVATILSLHPLKPLSWQLRE
jgi:hypothetical protein